MKDTIDSIIDEAIIDAYEYWEQITGFQIILEDRLKFPLSIQVIDQQYTATGIKEDNARLKWEIYLENKLYLVDIGDTTIVKGTEYDKLLVDAYLHWLKYQH